MSGNPETYIGRQVRGVFAPPTGAARAQQQADVVFELIRFVGGGKFAWVYEAKTLAGPVTGRIAVKLLYREDVQAVRRFQRETKVMRQLPPHPNCVAYKGHGTADKRPWFAMDFVDGFTLSMVLRSGRAIPERAACTLMAQLCDGFEAFHRLGLTHRDITPDNIMITQADRQVKLMDFGLVLDSQGLLQLYEQVDILDGKDFLDDLDAGLIAGTPEFMAPEQILDPHEKDRLRQKTDTTADVFALGTIFYQLISGAQLFPYERGARGATGKQALINYLDYRVRLRDDDLVCPPQVGAELWSILRKTLLRDPKMRQRDATELGADLRFYLETGQGVLEDDLSATIAQDFDARHMKSAVVGMSTGEFSTITQAAAEAHKASLPDLTLTGAKAPRPPASKLPPTHPQPPPPHVFEPPPLPPPPPAAPALATAVAAEPRRGGRPDAPLGMREPVTAPAGGVQSPLVKRAVVANPNLRPASIDARAGGIAAVADGERKGARRALLIGIGVVVIGAGVLLAVLLSRS